MGQARLLRVFVRCTRLLLEKRFVVRNDVLELLRVRIDILLFNGLLPQLIEGLSRWLSALELVVQVARVLRRNGLVLRFSWLHLLLWPH